jgi:hypothetical protein
MKKINVYQLKNTNDFYFGYSRKEAANFFSMRHSAAIKPNTIEIVEKDI